MENGFTPASRSPLDEAHIYHILEKAHLLEYFPSFQANGVDNIQQLFEANDDEFLEIMAIVGMASKPLHVRRFQKALNDWVDILNKQLSEQNISDSTF